MSTTQNQFAQSDLYSPPAGMFEFIRRNKFKFATTVVLGLILTVAYLSIATRQYRSTAKLFIKMGRETVVLDPTAHSKQATSISDSREQEVFAIAELMKSRALAEKVVDHFGVDVILERKPNQPSMGEHLSFLDAANLNPLRVYSLRDEAVVSFHENFGVLAGKRTNVVSLWYEAESPELAREVLEFVVGITLDAHIRIHRTRGSEEYFVGKVESSGKRLDLLESQLQDFKTESGLASLTNQRDDLLALIAKLRAEVLEAQSEEKSLIAGLEERHANLTGLSQMILIQEATGQPQAVGQTLREKLFELEIQEKDLTSKYSVEHPQVRQLLKQIAEVRAISEGEKSTTEKTQGVNPVYYELESEALKNEAALAEVQAKVIANSADLEVAESRIAFMNSAELKITKLEREIEMSREILKTNMDMLEQARIDNELEARKISSLNVMEPPTTVETPFNPKPLLTLCVGGILSLMAGVSVALIFGKPRSHAAPQLEAVRKEAGPRREPIAVCDTESDDLDPSTDEHVEPVAVGESSEGIRVPR